MSVLSSRRIARALFVAAGPFVLTACVTVMRTVNPSGSARAELTHSIDSLTSQPIFRNAQWGVLIVNPRTGDTLYSKNAGKLFMPASNMKIVTSAVALTLLGADYSYRTTFATDGEVRDSLLDGNLIVIGRGDPTISDNMRGLATLVMDTLADSVRAHGIRQVTGSLARVGNAFPDSIHGYGWEWDDLGEYYAAGVDELIFNEGMAPTSLRPPPDTVRDSLYSGPAKDPATGYLNAFNDALVRKHINVETGVMDSILPTPIKMDTLFVYVSPQLRSILPALMKPSQNQIAEILLKTIGLERGGMGTADSARKIVAQQLLAWGVQPDGFAIYDGSGLSRHDLVSPETLVRILDRIQQDTAFSVYYNAMPIAGVDGTLKDRMKGTPAEGNVHAKTGSIGAARSLSGYVTSADGERLIFSILANNWTTPSSAVTGVADQIVAALAAYRAH
ncbi:MAG TPA: D-alanyl-D-alanine carboxypeptidase/D-alanyl-D-alanine-endopeptidase [Gemmatimonadaceae bacterium]|nr:D-alanyl-D-alanine carboxypeptidase/D-alanyl-D-alanine-endopeptidase [Gemmatimonadaceae bacterium]